jgi:hypothetical protein
MLYRMSEYAFARTRERYVDEISSLYKIHDSLNYFSLTAYSERFFFTPTASSISCDSIVLHFAYIFTHHVLPQILDASSFLFRRKLGWTSSKDPPDELAAGVLIPSKAPT